MLRERVSYRLDLHAQPARKCLLTYAMHYCMCNRGHLCAAKSFIFSSPVIMLKKVRLTRIDKHKLKKWNIWYHVTPQLERTEKNVLISETWSELWTRTRFFSPSFFWGQKAMRAASVRKNVAHNTLTMRREWIVNDLSFGLKKKLRRGRNVCDGRRRLCAAVSGKLKKESFYCLLSLWKRSLLFHQVFYLNASGKSKKQLITNCRPNQSGFFFLSRCVRGFLCVKKVFKLLTVRSSLGRSETSCNLNDNAKVLDPYKVETNKTKSETNSWYHD